MTGAQQNGSARTAPEGLTLRAWEDGDDLRLLEVFGDPVDVQQHQDRAMLAASSDTPWRRCIVAEVDSVPVGAAVVYASSLHPQRLWLYVETAASERGRGIGSALLDALRRIVTAAHAAGEVTTTALKSRYGLAPEDTRTVAEGEELPELDLESHAERAAQAEATGGFLAARGFTRIQRSRRVAVAARSVALPTLRTDQTPEGVSLEESSTGSVELTRAVAAFYNGVHEWDPAEMSLGQAQQMLLGPDTGAAGAVVLRDRPGADGGAIRAFAVSYTAERQEDPADVLLGWDPELEDTEAKQAVADLLALLVVQHPVQIEVDDSMTALAPIVDGLLTAGYAQVLADASVVATA
ncbi:GNAT family N-acetyltransferase [Micrococcus lylae]|uniref:N-acetyltransferase n=1 Tax=Micrococcus lylae TaxID=1273 RepID=A0ABY2K249_9MICC|nr:GNAT family N-acetyltransferase [Micrococcus lylae]TFI01238.1 N-acetyltransferase [Micrococcus lylae]WIK82416.1 GNAT family N-acetyltransferase [Micrococcus lylae]